MQPQRLAEFYQNIYVVRGVGVCQFFSVMSLSKNDCNNIISIMPRLRNPNSFSLQTTTDLSSARVGTELGNAWYK